MSKVTITKKEYPDLWDCLIEDAYTLIHQGQRKGESYWEKAIYLLSQEYCPNLPKELEGYWETDDYATSESWGSDDEINVLYRVELKLITTYEYQRVKDK